MLWVTNPFANHLFLPFAGLTLALLTVGACALLLVQHLRLSLAGTVLLSTSVPLSVLWQRYRTWAIIAIVFIIVSFCGPLTRAMLCAFLCWQGIREYAALTNLPRWHQLAIVLAGLTTCAAVLVAGPSVLGAAPVIAFFAWSLLSLQPTAQDDPVAQRFTSGLNSLWGYLYLGWLPVYLLALSYSKHPGLTLTVGLGVALSDVGAFCVGKAFRGPKLAPLLSPSKTWSGVLGNILGASLAVALTSYALAGLPLWKLALLALTIALGSLWGDLLESLLKRQHGVKDAGAFLPGFGGLLDRIDSLLLVAPLVYYLSVLLF